MGIKEKELEVLVLKLLDTSLAIQNKIRGMCSATQESAVMLSSNTSQTSESNPGLIDKTSSPESKLKQYEIQLTQCQNEMQEYKSHSEQLQATCTSLERRVSCLESELKKTEAELEASKRQFGELERENSLLEEDKYALSSRLKAANEEINILKERFSNPVILLDRYKSLPASIRTGLSDVICDKDEVLFIASCSTSEHLKAIWTYTKKLTSSNSDANSIDILKEIFDYFFDVFNSSLREPMYVRDSVEAGHSFDDDKYDRCTGSSTSGKITQVILRGYKSVNTGTIICRSFVRV